MPLQNGTKLGDYEIVRPLGRGGMGDVYLGHDTALDRPVAIKTILAPDPYDDDMLKRFKQEAQSAARLIHPNIVQIFRVDLEADPPYMAMEFVDGRTLEELIKQDGALTWQRALTVCGQVLSALSIAHDQGIVHRDIKPANIMVDAKGRVKVTDFGLAKIMNSSLQMTRDNQSIGSPYYMSPEHWGEGEIGPSSDIFSLGITLFELISGRLPFEAKSAPEMMMKITTKPLPPLAAYTPGIPKSIQQFVETMAAREPHKRYQTADQVIADLQSLKSKQPPIHMQRLLQASGNSLPEDGYGDPISDPERQSVSAFHKHVPHEPEGMPGWTKAAIAGGVSIVLIAGGLVLSSGSSQPAQSNNPQIINEPPLQGGPQQPPPGGQPDSNPDASLQSPNPLQQSPFLQNNRPGPGSRNNVRPPRLGEDFNVNSNGQVTDARTGEQLHSTQHDGHSVPAIQNPDGRISPAGRTADGRWVPLPPPPVRPR